MKPTKTGKEVDEAHGELVKARHCLDSGAQPTEQSLLEVGGNPVGCFGKRLQQSKPVKKKTRNLPAMLKEQSVLKSPRRTETS